MGICDFTMKLADGTQRSLSEYRGKAPLYTYLKKEKGGVMAARSNGTSQSSWWTAKDGWSDASRPRSCRSKWKKRFASFVKEGLPKSEEYRIIKITNVIQSEVRTNEPDVP